MLTKEEVTNKVLEYLWKDELISFEVCYDTDVLDHLDTPEQLDKQIKWCEDEDCTEHVFYYLMKLKQLTNETKR